ncbi:DUF3820 family protein [Pseudomonas asuensis]|jgi:uncharacterized protein (DUF3820 family)|uniref:DUF3820 family protein n=1 Tax=Pseudomonas asuensis TaxID=1825787 RepID=A0ABQ2GUK7_9PSED|nr:DUF3820 family protein [Pseudomonas asuensis]GGM14130.1 hypothetical protein GCM10009425_26490 [Pseudomonas asuensis]
MDPKDLQLLVTREMPYGKYKGRVIADLPGHYLNWFAREGFPKGEIGRLIQLMQEIDHNGLSTLLEPLRKAHPPKYGNRFPDKPAKPKRYSFD